MIPSFDQKPESGGMPASASAPTRKAAWVYGITLRRPPIRRMSCSPREVVDDHAGREEEQRLEEGVRHQVEHRVAVGADPGREEHVADLRHRRVRDHALDVPLHERDHAGDDDRDAADDRRQVLDVRGGLEDRVRADDQVDAGRHHRRGVDEGGDGRRAFHRVGEPGVERQLGGLGDRAAEQAERDEVRRARRELRRSRPRRTSSRSRASRSWRSAGRSRAPSPRRRSRS